MTDSNPQSQSPQQAQSAPYAQQQAPTPGYVFPPQGYYYPQQPYPYPNPSDTGSIGWAVLGFFIPVAGLILWIVWKDQQPRNSKMAGIGALVSVIVSVVLLVLWFALIMVLIANIPTS